MVGVEFKGRKTDYSNMRNPGILLDTVTADLARHTNWLRHTHWFRHAHWFQTRPLAQQWHECCSVDEPLSDLALRPTPRKEFMPDTINLIKTNQSKTKIMDGAVKASSGQLFLWLSK